MSCPKCQSTEITEAPQTFKNGIVHIRVACAACNSFIRWKGQHTHSKPFLMPFGKHKGKMLEQIPVNYLEWLLTESFVKGTLKRRIAEQVSRRTRTEVATH